MHEKGRYILFVITFWRQGLCYNTFSLACSRLRPPSHYRRKRLLKENAWSRWLTWFRQYPEYLVAYLLMHVLITLGLEESYIWKCQVELYTRMEKSKLFILWLIWTGIRPCTTKGKVKLMRILRLNLSDEREIVWTIERWPVVQAATVLVAMVIKKQKLRLKANWLHTCFRR